jgi:hypothetical protein
MSTGKVDISSEIAALKFNTERFDVWGKTNLFREPIFLQSILIISFYGIGNAIVQVLFKRDLISIPIKEALYPFLYLFPIIGSLYIIGGFSIRRANLIVLYMSLYSLYDYAINKYLHGIHSIVGIFEFIPGFCLIVCWIVSQPKLMGKVGLRKSNSLSDFLYASILILTIAAYAIHIFIVYGFKLEFRPVEMTDFFLGNFISCVFVTSYCYGVWNLLKARGANTFQSILALLTLFTIIGAPVMISFAVIGVARPFITVAGIVMNSLLTVSVMHFSFSALKNSLAATFLLSMVMLLLKTAGVY